MMGFLQLIPDMPDTVDSVMIIADFVYFGFHVTPNRFHWDGDCFHEIFVDVEFGII
jgi:hypothetical protein